MRRIFGIPIALFFVAVCLAPSQSTGITQPRLLTKVEPQYTQAARKARVEGSVLLQAVIGVDGVPRDFTVMSPLGYGLDDKAIEAVSQWRFDPGRKDGVPVDVTSSFQINFRLGTGVSDSQFKSAEDSRTSYNLGVHYLKGDNVPQDLAKARRAFEKAAKADYAPAQFALANMLLNGEGGEKNELEAFNWFRKAADQKMAKAQYFVGRMYSEGKGVWRNDVDALKWYRAAAQQEEPAAEGQLGLMYEKGIVVPADPGEAMKWYRRSAEHGYTLARYHLAVFYRDGLAGETDPVQALAWMRLSISYEAPAAQSEADKIAENLSPAEIQRAEEIVKKWSTALR